VLDIVVPEDVLVRRLASRRICSKCGANAAVEWTGDCQKCGGKLIARVDDSVSIVRERLEVFLRQTRPLVDYYSTRSTFRLIDGNHPPDVVSASIEAALVEACRSAAL
jgi:adenylate kinase